MNFAVYSGAKQACLRHFESVIEDMESTQEVCVYRDISELRRELHRPGKQLKLIVLYAADRNDLESILLLNDLLRDIRIVLILPDLDEATVSLAHRLHPRFLAPADTDKAELRTILGNLFRLYG
jgi:hypothetical protein